MKNNENGHWIFYNPNRNRVGDCTIRALTKALNKSWDEVYSGTALEGFLRSDMPSSDAVWHSYLKRQGFKPHFLPDDFPYEYTVNDFCEDFPEGLYVVCLSGHVVCVEDGFYYDSWDSGDELVVSYFSRD